MQDCIGVAATPIGGEVLRPRLPEEPLDRGLIIGVVNLVDCIEYSDSEWAVRGRLPDSQSADDVGESGVPDRRAWRLCRRRPPRGVLARAPRVEAYRVSTGNRFVMSGKPRQLPCSPPAGSALDFGAARPVTVSAMTEFILQFPIQEVQGDALVDQRGHRVDVPGTRP